MTLLQMIEVMKACSRGETIEGRHKETTEWKTFTLTPDWNWKDCIFRVKPREPRVYYMLLRDDYQPQICQGHIDYSEACQKADFLKGDEYKVVKFVEVVEDQKGE